MLAVIGGTGLSAINCFNIVGSEEVSTSFSGSAVEVTICEFKGQRVAFLPRHGSDHTVPPHKINYRANIAALKKLGVRKIVAINAVGSIHADLKPGSFAVPHQLIDYSHSRESTFFDNNDTDVTHIDFTVPFSEELRKLLINSATQINTVGGNAVSVLNGGVYGVTQGPRLETAAEITRLKSDGCDMVGMTAMPEAALARELGIDYACFAISVNWAAGLGEDLISLDEIRATLAACIGTVELVLQFVAAELPSS